MIGQRQLMNIHWSAIRLEKKVANGTVRKIADTTIEKFDPENMGVAAGISFLSALELEIPLGGISTSPPTQLQ